MDYISEGTYIPYSLRFVVRLWLFHVSWMNLAKKKKKVLISIDSFVKSIFLDHFYSLAICSVEEA